MAAGIARARFAAAFFPARSRGDKLVAVGDIDTFYSGRHTGICVSTGDGSFILQHCVERVACSNSRYASASSMRSLSCDLVM